MDPGSGIRVFRPDPDPDPNFSKYPDPTGSGSGSATLVIRIHDWLSLDISLDISQMILTGFLFVPLSKLCHNRHEILDKFENLG